MLSVTAKRDCEHCVLRADDDTQLLCDCMTSLTFDWEGILLSRLFLRSFRQKKTDGKVTLRIIKGSRAKAKESRCCTVSNLCNTTTFLTWKYAYQSDAEAADPILMQNFDFGAPSLASLWYAKCCAGSWNSHPMRCLMRYVFWSEVSTKNMLKV